MAAQTNSSPSIQEPQSKVNNSDRSSPSHYKSRKYKNKRTHASISTMLFGSFYIEADLDDLNTYFAALNIPKSIVKNATALICQNALLHIF
eukprot:485624_1